ncbi:MAG: type II toxin-antitoxin system HicB family antitoxin [Nitrospirales bacterium]|nr:type II toxin-antitoxin system HicB family antitoxin [Nitrospirales bacterium]
MNELPYSLVIERSERPGYYKFSSPDLKGFSGTGRSVEECVRSAKWGIMQYITLLTDQGLPIPPPNNCSRIVT